MSTLGFSLATRHDSAPALGRMMAMVDLVRMHTVGALNELSTSELDHQHDAYSNSVGMLLGHLIYNDIAFRAFFVEERELSDSEESTWGAGRFLWKRGRFEFRNRPLEQYVQELKQQLALTMKSLHNLNDRWLDEVPRRALAAGQSTTNGYLLFHKIEDECRHQGQILWLLHRIPGYRLAFWNRPPSERPPLRIEAVNVE
jgi:uncharacterized damage-inducible protein DinB